MSDNQEHPFQPGVKVASIWCYRGGDRRISSGGVVDKVHKNGNFTLVGDAKKQQFKASQMTFGRRHWVADATGNKESYSRSSHLEVWDDRIDAELAAQQALSARRKRLNELQAAVAVLRAETVSEELLTALAAALEV